MEKRSLIVFLLNHTEPSHLVKDPGSYAYYLSKECGWKTSFAYFSSEEFHNPNFEKYTELVYLGSENDFGNQQQVIKQYIKSHASKLDIVMLMNYGSATYHLAAYCKKVNKNITVYSKLDMGESGFAHFYDGTWQRKLKNYVEVWKSRHVDCFTVENRYFYDILKQTSVFKDKIGYIPNCVCTADVDVEAIDCETKENIIITVGRLGDWYKNNELLIDAVGLLPDSILSSWKLYLVGPCTAELQAYVKQKIAIKPILKDFIVLTGAVYDRTELYKLYARAKIFTLTSRSESFGIATIEAMYFGAYPILTDFGSITRDITKDEKYGRVVKNFVPNALCTGLIDITRDEELEKKCFIVQDYTRQSFDYEKWAKTLAEYLEDR